jgi:hypothetical protein
MIFIFLTGCLAEYDERLEGTWFSNKERTLKYLSEKTAAELQIMQLEMVNSGEIPIIDLLSEDGLNEMLPAVRDGFTEEGMMHAYLQENLGDMGFIYKKNKTTILLKSDPGFTIPWMTYKVVEKTDNSVIISVEQEPKGILTFEDDCYYIQKGNYREYFCKEN